VPLHYIENPTNVSFAGQDSDETILLLLRAHIITNLKWIIPAILVFLLPLLLPRFLSFVGILFPNLPDTYILVLLVINYLLVLIIVFEGFLFWYFNVYIVSTKRIVDISFINALSKKIDMVPLGDVQEATAHQAGLLGLIFNFGNVFIQTESARPAIDFIDVPRPDQVSDFILDRALEVKETGAGS